MQEKYGFLKTIQWTSSFYETSLLYQTLEMEQSMFKSSCGLILDLSPAILFALSAI